VVAGGFTVVLAIWLLINKFLLEIFPSLDLMTYFMQILAIVCRFNYKSSPVGVEYYELILDVALFDIDILKPSCVIPWNFTYPLCGNDAPNRHFFGNASSTRVVAVERVRLVQF